MGKVEHFHFKKLRI